MKRSLTDDEIEYILNFIEINKHIPLNISKQICKKNKNKLVNQLKKIQIYPELIDTLKDEIKNYYMKSLIHPGESVGVLCAQSIGEKQTQGMLNTFHKAGMSEKTMTSGVPRFQELINATKKPKIVNNKIYLHNGPDYSLEDAKEIIGCNLTCLYLKDLIKSFTIVENSEHEDWYEIFDNMYNINYQQHKFCVKFKLNLEKLFSFKLTLKKIAFSIEKSYPDVFCVHSPLHIGEIHIYPDVSKIELMTNPTLFITNDNKQFIYLEECVIPILENICVAGIEGITEVFYTKEKNEWIVETNGINSRNISLTFINYKKLLALPFIDFAKTLSNNVWDILAVLGIEAARNALIEEFMNIMDGINKCHAILLVERMTFAGSISSITRYTMKKDENGPFGKASFEETMDNFLNAAAKGEIEPTESVSASIVCGKRAGIGTGLSNIKVNLDMIRDI